MVGKRVEGVERGIIDGCLLKELLVWWKRRKDLKDWL